MPNREKRAVMPTAPSEPSLTESPKRILRFAPLLFVDVLFITHLLFHFSVHSDQRFSYYVPPHSLSLLSRVTSHKPHDRTEYGGCITSRASNSTRRHAHGLSPRAWVLQILDVLESYLYLTRHSPFLVTRDLLLGFFSSPIPSCHGCRPAHRPCWLMPPLPHCSLPTARQRRPPWLGADSHVHRENASSSKTWRNTGSHPITSRPPLHHLLPTTSAASAPIPPLSHLPPPMSIGMAHPILIPPRASRTTRP